MPPIFFVYRFYTFFTAKRLPPATKPAARDVLPECRVTMTALAFTAKLRPAKKLTLRSFPPINCSHECSLGGRNYYLALKVVFYYILSTSPQVVLVHALFFVSSTLWHCIGHSPI